MIDLDECNFMESSEDADLNDIDKAFNFKEETFKYEESVVDFKEFTQIHIRGESRKENIDFKLQLQVFILHEDKIYRWTPEVSSLDFVCSVSFPRMIPVNDGSFFIKQDLFIEGSEMAIAEDFKLVTLDFSFYEIKHVYRENSITEDVIEFSYDKIAKKLIFFLES